MNENENLRNSSQLIELGGSDYEIAEGQPDIRGWKVKNAQDQTIGEVDELIFDPTALKVRYLVLDLEGNVLDLEPRNVLVPIGVAELHESDDVLYLNNVTADHLTALPVYSSDNLNSNTESEVRRVFGGIGAAGVAGAAAASGTTQHSDYDSDVYNEDNLYRRRMASRPPATEAPATGTDSETIPIIEENLEVGKRTIETGGARIRAKVLERPVEEDINLREENVYVERNPVNRPASEADLQNFKEGEIEITEHAEVPVVSKEANVVEEVTIRKEVEEHDTIIRDTVHKTDVEVDEIRPGETRTGTTLEDDDYLDDDASRRNRRTNPDTEDPVI
ncbi:PRC and DUF2382 domain-containing protein [Pontibacter sp. 13R65]|uniref:PRC and DUF2382 domain-containing protein n=1 Tax=Pontibacter sp. 13R65 TaxID=3127458 RepID=UPI00301BD068